MGSVRKRMFFEDDGGFSTVGMALALMLSVSLVLSAAQVYRVRSMAADAQNVADACAMAGQNQIAAFYVVAQVCDCAVFSLSAAGTALVGAGVVAACVPAAQQFSGHLIKAGKSVLDARDSFAQSCASGLNRLQGVLPAIAAVKAAAVARANSTDGASYYAVAVLAPYEGEAIGAPDPLDGSENLDDVVDVGQRVSDAASSAEEAASAANAHRTAAYMADCGAAPAYCMYERAQVLAGMHGTDNPSYGSEDAWSFGVALKRARAYYWNRYTNEAPASDSVEEQARSAIRQRFYAYAVNALADGYVYESEDSFDAHFPLLPRNTDEMRATWLYTEGAYPVSENAEGVWTEHAWDGCPGMEGEAFVGMGSVEQMEVEGFPQCPVCGFSASSVGKVAAASTSIDNGFEHHYRIVALEAAAYQKERQELSRMEESVKNPVKDMLDKLKRMLSSASDSRLKVRPPGSIGCIAVVIAPGGFSLSDMVGSNLVGAGGTLGPRAAVSAATLAEDDSDELETVVSSLLDGLLGDSAALALPSVLLGAWSDVLVAYTKGTKSLSDNIASALNSLPLIGKTGLGTWASARLNETIEAAGLAPPDLVSHKPVLLNSYHVASADDAALSRRIVQGKEALSHAHGSLPADSLSALVSLAGGRAETAYEKWDATFVVATIQLAGADGATVPLEITLPPSLKDAGANLIDGAIENALDATGSLAGVRRWE